MRDRAAVHRRGPFAAAAGFFEHRRVDLFVFAAHFDLHFRGRGDDVPAFPGAQVPDVDAGHAFAVAREAHQRQRRGGGGRQGVPAHFGLHPGVRGRPLEAEVDLRRAEELLRGRHHFAAGDVAADVHHVEEVDVVQNARLRHGARPAHALFGRLEAELDAARQVVLIGGEPLRHHHPDRLVTVVAAGVHVARAAGGVAARVRAVRRILRFGHRHAVQLKAHRDRRTGAAGVQNPHDPRDPVHADEHRVVDALLTRRGEPFLDLAAVRAADEVGVDHLAAAEDREARLLQVTDHARGGDELRPTGFGPGVDFTAERDDAGFVDGFKVGHGEDPPLRECGKSWGNGLGSAVGALTCSGPGTSRGPRRAPRTSAPRCASRVQADSP